jgi:hypothetical protein
MLPNQIRRVNVAQVVAYGHEVIDPAGLEVDFHRIQSQQSRLRLFAMKHHVKVAPKNIDS